MAGLEARIFKDIKELSTLHTTAKYFDPNPEPAGLLENYEVWKSMIDKHC
jgi:glycerol kinase